MGPTFRGDQVWYESSGPFLSNHFEDYAIAIFRWGSPVGHVPIRSIHHILSKVLSLFHLIGQFQQAGKHPLILTHTQMIHWLFLVFNFWPIGCQKLNSQSELRIKNWPNFAFRTPSSSISFSIKSCREIVSLSMFRQNPIDPKFDPKWPLPTDFDLDPFDSDFFLWFLALFKMIKNAQKPKHMHFFTKFLISGDRFTPLRIYNFSQSHFKLFGPGISVSKNKTVYFTFWNLKSFTS